MKTFDGVKVNEGDAVYVFSSTGNICTAHVMPPVTTYCLFGNIEVKNSFSSYEEAKKYKEQKNA